MTRPTHQESTAIEKRVHYSQFPRGEGMPCRAGGATKVSQQTDGVGEL